MERLELGWGDYWRESCVYVAIYHTERTGWGAVGVGGGEGEGLQENRCIDINQPLSATATGLGGQR